MPQHREELIPTRTSLINRLKDWQDQSSWKEFFDTYWKLIYGVARKSGLIDAEAQDVVQEVLASVAKHMPTFQYDPKIGSFKAWLLKNTRWCIIAQFRKRGPHFNQFAINNRETAQTDLVERVVNPAGQPLDAIWEIEWEQTLLEKAFAKVKRSLHPQSLQIFDFYATKGWPTEKVAKHFGVSMSDVYVTKHRVTAALQSEIKRLEEEMI